MLWGPEEDEPRYVPPALLNSSPIRNAYHRLSISNSDDENTDDDSSLTSKISIPSKNKTGSIPTAIEFRAPTDVECGLLPLREEAWIKIEKPLKSLCEWLINSPYASVVSGYDRSTIARAIAHYINLQHTDEQQFARVVLIVVRSDAAAKIWMRELTQVLDELPINLFGMAVGKRNICFNSLQRLTHPGVILTPEKAIKSANDGLTGLNKALENNPFVQTWDIVFSEVLGGDSWLNADYCPFRMIADKRANNAFILDCKDEKKSKTGFNVETVSNFIDVNMTRLKEHEKLPENFWCSAVSLNEKKKNEKNVKEIQKQDLQKMIKDVKNSTMMQIEEPVTHDNRKERTSTVVEKSISHPPQNAPIRRSRSKSIALRRNGETDYNDIHLTLDKNEKAKIQAPRIKPRKPSPKKRERSTRDKTRANLALSTNSSNTAEKLSTRNITVKAPSKDSNLITLNKISQRVYNKWMPNANTNDSSKVGKGVNSKVAPQKSLSSAPSNNNKASSPTTSGQEWVTPNGSIERGSSPDIDNEEWYTPRTSLEKHVEQPSEDNGDDMKLVITPIMENPKNEYPEIEKPSRVNRRRTRNKNSNNTNSLPGENLAKSASRNRTQSMPKPFRVFPEPTASNTLNISPILNRERNARKKPSSSILISTNKIKLDKRSEKKVEPSSEEQPGGSGDRETFTQPPSTNHIQKRKSSRRRRSASLNGINNVDSISEEKRGFPESRHTDILDKPSTEYRRRSLGSRANIMKNDIIPNVPSHDESNVKDMYSKKETSRYLRSNSVRRGVVSKVTQEKNSKVSSLVSSRRESRGNPGLKLESLDEPNGETRRNVIQSNPVSNNQKAIEKRAKDLKCTSGGNGIGETQRKKSYLISPSHKLDEGLKDLSEKERKSGKRWSMSRLRREVLSAPPKNTEKRVNHNRKDRKDSPEHIDHDRTDKGNIVISHNRSTEYEFQPLTDNENESKNLISLGLRLDDDFGLVANIEKNTSTANDVGKSYTKDTSQRPLPTHKTLDKKRRSSGGTSRSNSSPIVFPDGFFDTPLKRTTSIGERLIEGNVRRRRGSNEHKNRTIAPKMTTTSHLEGIIDTSESDHIASVRLFDDISLSRGVVKSRNTAGSSRVPKTSDPDDDVILISDDDDRATLAKSISSKQPNSYKIPKQKSSKSFSTRGSKTGSRQDGNYNSQVEREASIDVAGTSRRQERRRSSASGRERSSQTYLKNIRKLKPSFSALSRDDQIKYKQNLQKAKDAEKKGRSGHKDALGYYIECADIYDGDEDITSRILSLATSTGSARASDFTRGASKKTAGNATRKPRGVAKPAKSQRKRRSYEGQVSRTITNQSAHSNEVIVID